MAAAPSFGHLADVPAPGPPEADSRMRVALLADLSGRATARPVAELANIKPVPVDPDDLDRALSAVGPSVKLGGILGSPVEMAFTSLDDFHPDAIYKAADKFSDLDDTDARTDYMKAILRHPRFRHTGRPGFHAAFAPLPDIQTAEAGWRRPIRRCACRR